MRFGRLRVIPRGVLPCFLIVVFAVAALAGARAAEPPAVPHRPPGVLLSSPRDGPSSDRILHVQGTIDDESVSQVTVILNGSAYQARVRQGAFSRNLVASPGQNFVEVFARNAYGTGHASVSVLSKVPRNAIQVVMWWDADQSDLDLWVTDPQGEKCFYQHRTTEAGGSLDVDVTDGYGPETFTSSQALPGTYQVQVHLYGDRRPESERKPIRVFARVILFEGTDREVRKDYSLFIERPNEILNLTTFNVFAQ